MQHASEIVILMIKQAIDGLSSFDDDTPYWLRTANATEKVENRPMVRLQNEESLNTYITYLRRFVAYILRVFQAQKEKRADESTESDSDEDESSNGPGELANDTESDNEFAAIVEEDAVNVVSLFVDEVSNSEGNEETGELHNSNYSNSNSNNNKDTDTMKDCCELLKLNQEQEQRVQDVLDSLNVEEDESVQVSKMQAFVMSTIIQNLKGKDRFESPLVHFAAVLGIVEDENRLRRGDEYSYMLAGMMYCIRVLFVEDALPSATREEQTSEDIDRFLELRKNYLVVGSYSPCSFLIKWLGYGKTMSMQKLNQPIITWNRSESNRPDGDILEFHGKPLPIKRLQNAIHDIIQEAEEILWEQCIWITDKKNRFEIDLDKIQDDLSSTDRGGSWVTNEVNGFSDTKEWMIKQMLKAPKHKQLWDNKKETWRMTRVHEYRKCWRELCDLRMVLKHMTVGPQARGNELTSLRHRNGFLQARNDYIIHGMLCYVIRYHKSQALFGEPKVIPRFVPWRVAQIEAVCAAYVHPFMESLDQLTGGLPRSDYIWHDKNGPLTTEHLTKLLKQETGIRLGLPLTTNDLRHIYIDLTREYVGKNVLQYFAEIEDMAFEGDDVIVSAMDLAAAHGPEIAVRYGTRGDIIRNLSDESIRIFGSVCTKFHRLLGLDSKKPSRSTKHQRALSFDMSATTPSRWPKTPVKQSLQFTFLPPQIGSSPMEVSTPARTPISRVEWPSISPSPPNWSANMALNFGTPVVPHQSRVPEIAPSGVLPMNHVPTYSEDEIYEGLRKVLQLDDAQFRSTEQKEAVLAALDLQSPLCVVFPTGGGKTLVFTLPAVLRDPGVTIVVAPYQALEKDYIPRLQKAQIEHVVWRHGETRYAPVVVVSADRAASTGFITYGSMLRKRKVLRRVVFDECHLAFTADYRIVMRRLGHLHVLRCPMILLTATLPPSRVHELQEVMHIPNFRLIRMSTVRPNIRYMVRRCPDKSRLQLIQEMARSRNPKKGEWGVFFCTSRDDTEAVASVLDCPYYHSTIEAKGATIAAWLKEKDSGFIAATGALGTGVDYPGIVYIVHVGVPYGLIDFAQESGRGGRATGDEVDSIILLEEGEYQKLVKQEAAELTEDELAMRGFIETRDCRRFAMSGYLDDEGQTCEEIGGRLCDCCGGGIADWTTAQVREAQELQKFETLMHEIQRHCGFCWVTYGAREAEHKAMDCSRTEGLNLDQSEWLRSGIRYDRRCRDCWKCGISEEICKGIELERACQWNGVVPVVLLSWFHLPQGQEVLAQGGYQGNDITAYRKWLGLRARQKVRREVVSNGMWLLWTMIQGSDQTKAQHSNDEVEVEGRPHEEEHNPAESAAAGQEPEAEQEARGGSEAEQEARGEVALTSISIVDEPGLDRAAQMIEWLSKYCIYCEMTRAPISNSEHWYQTCYRWQGLGDQELGYDESVDWQIDMDKFRHGACPWCQKAIDDCGTRSSLNEITCIYGDIVMPVVFILYKQGWVEKWMQKKGYRTGFGVTQLQRWLNSKGREGEGGRIRAMEAFSDYSQEFQRKGFSN
jgi:superfamily II DNA helicase RecQ